MLSLSVKPPFTQHYQSKQCVSHLHDVCTITAFPLNCLLDLFNLFSLICSRTNNHEIYEDLWSLLLTIIIAKRFVTMWYFYATVEWETCLHSRVLYSSLLSAAQSDSKALYRFLSADEIKKTAVCVWCAFQQRDLPVSSRYGLRGEFLWGGLNSSLSSIPPPLPSILAEHKQLAGLCSACTTCLPQCCSQVTISQGQRLRGIVELRFLCVPLAIIVRTGTENSAHSIAGRQSESQRERVGSEERGYQNED